VARQPSEINPDDVYLPSNLGDGDPWARQVVNDLIALKKEARARRQSESGANRGDAASRASLADQFATLVGVDGSEASLTISNVQVTWASAGQITVTAPVWATRAVIVGIGVVGADNATVAYMAQLDARIAVDGSAAPGVTLSWANWAAHSTNTGTIARTRVMTVTGGQVIPIRVDLQGTISGFTGNINLSAVAIFTR